MTHSQDNRIHRHTYNSDFTILPNKLWERSDLSWGAKSLLAYMISRPLDWEIYRSQLSKIYKGEKKGNGAYSVDGWFEELIKLGYIIYTPQDKETGKFIHRYDVYPEPQELKKFPPKVVKPPTDPTPCGQNHPQPSNDYLPSNEKDNNKEVVVCPFLSDLKLDIDHKIRLSKAHASETLRIAVERVLAWEGRQSDAGAIETILKRSNEWQDKPDKQAAKVEAERLMDVIRPYDGKRINEMLIVVGKDYVEFSGGVSYYEVFKAEDPNFATLLGLKLEKLGLPKN